MPQRVLASLAELEKTDAHIHLSLTETMPTISSAVLNGGLSEARHILNWKVPKSSSVTEAPAVSLRRYADQQGWGQSVVGLMTAASMNSFRMAHECEQGVDLFVMATSGLDNARRAGDLAEYRAMLSEPLEVGTINIIVLSSARMTSSAMIEAMMLVTEAKTAALHDAKILSPVSDQIATGTGTDSVVMSCAPGEPNLFYAGKHVLFGELLGKMTYAVINASIQRSEQYRID